MNNPDYLLYSVRLRRNSEDKRERLISSFIDNSVHQKHKKKELFMDAFEALIEKRQGNVLPPKRLLVEASFDNFLGLMHDIKDALRNAQLSGQAITSVDVDRFESSLTEIKEAWDTSHLGKEGEFYD